MKIKIEIPYGAYLVFPTTPETGTLMLALAGASVIKEDGYGKDKTYKLHDEKVKIELLDDNFDAKKSDPFVKLQEQVASHQTSWHEEFNKRMKLEGELKEIKAKLAALTEAATNAATPKATAKTDDEPAF